MLYKVEHKSLFIIHSKLDKIQGGKIHVFRTNVNHFILFIIIYQLLLRASRLIYRGLAARGGFRRGCGGAVSTL